MRVKRAAKYGFCAGVRIADKKVKKFAAAGGRGSILGQVVHNERVVEEMEALGVRTVESLDEAAEAIVFSAHGVPTSYHERARARGLRILDTTCPFVYDIHDEASVALGEGAHLVFIGDPRHREVIGYTHDLDPERYHVLTTVEEAAKIDWRRYSRIKIFYQTTLNSEEFEELARYIEEHARDARRADTICYATKENQEAAHELGRDPEIDVILVIGGKRSANTRHLWEICQRYKPSFLVQGVSDLREEWFTAARGVGLTAGASTPDYVVDEVEEALARRPLPAATGIPASAER
jgi:(E)-4-hydroxy-3-methyl-but-2-enyl pyrophosphate reductase